MVAAVGLHGLARDRCGGKDEIVKLGFCDCGVSSNAEENGLGTKAGFVGSLMVGLG
jgi:hypothetical protein